MAELKRRLIAGVINRYEPEEGWENVHLDKSDRPLYGGQRPELVADIESIPAEPSSFDEIVCSQTLEHLPLNKATKALGEFFRVLRGGGRLKLDVPNMDVIADMWVNGNGAVTKDQLSQVIYGERLVQEDPLMHHLQAWWPESLAKALGKEGFGQVDFRSEGVTIFAETVKL